MTKIILSLAALFSSAPAFAQSQQFDQFAPDYDSGGVEYLRRVFGSIVDTVLTNGQNSVDGDTLLGAFMSVFGVGAFFLGFVYLIYNLVRGMVDSAEDGAFLGKKASSAWLPLRLAVGTTLMAPYASGFSLIQFVVIWLALQGVGMADMAFNAVLVQFRDTQMIQNPVLPDTRPLIGSILRSQVCASAMNRTYQDAGMEQRVTVTSSVEQHKSGRPVLNLFEKPKEVRVIKWEVPGEKSPVCGGLRWQRSSSFERDLRVVQQELLDAHNGATVQLIDRLQGIANDLVFSETVDFVAQANRIKAEVGQAERDYIANLRSIAVDALAKTNEGAMDDFIKQADHLGFLYAGMWMGHLNEWSNATQQALNALPVSQPIEIQGRYDPAMTQTVDDYLVFIDELTRTTTSTTEQVFGGDGLPEPNSVDSAKNWVNQFTLGLTSATINAIGGGTLSHLTNLRDFGDFLLSTSEVAMLAMSTAIGTAGGKFAEYTVGLGFSGLEFLKSLSGPIMMAIIGLMTLGGVLSTYMVLMPMIAWIIATLNWLICVIEAVIAAPLFAAAHLHPDGDERIGNAGEGYRLLLNVIMRPSLMVAGMLMGLMLAETIMGFANEIFMPAVRGAQNGSVVGLVKYIALVSAYVTLAMALMGNCFAMVHLLPDRVMLYLGRSIAGLGGSERIEADMQRGVSVAGGQIQNVGISAVKSSAERNAERSENQLAGAGKARVNRNSGTM